MKREIKFRVWDKENKVYLIREQIQVTLNPTSLVWVYTLPNNEGGDSTIEWCIDHPEGFEVEQYTGLKDVNGKEIYEGDILAYSYEYRVRKYGGDTSTAEYSSGRTFCRFVDGCFEFDAVGHVGRRMEKHELGENTNASWSSRYYDFKVIGNIHENPELIK